MGCLPYKLYRLFQTPHSFSVTIFTLGFRLFFFILLQINYYRVPSVSRGVVCFHSDGLGCSWTFTVTVFKDLRGPALYVSLYISLVFSLRRFA